MSVDFSDQTSVLIMFRPVFTQLVFQRVAQLLIVDLVSLRKQTDEAVYYDLLIACTHYTVLSYLCLHNDLYVAGQVVDLHLVLTLLLLQLLFDSLQVVDLLSQLGHTVGVFLP